MRTYWATKNFSKRFAARELFIWHGEFAVMPRAVSLSHPTCPTVSQCCPSTGLWLAYEVAFERKRLKKKCCMDRVQPLTCDIACFYRSSPGDYSQYSLMCVIRLIFLLCFHGRQQRATFTVLSLNNLFMSSMSLHIVQQDCEKCATVIQ